MKVLQIFEVKSKIPFHVLKNSLYERTKIDWLRDAVAAWRQVVLKIKENV